MIYKNLNLIEGKSITCQSLEDVNWVSWHWSFQNTRVWQRQPKESKQVKNYTIVWTVTNSTKSHFLLKSFNLKSLCMVLMLIPLITIDKRVISWSECILTLWISEIKFLLVLYEYVFHDILNTSNISTLINRFYREIILWCSMCNNFFSSCSIFCTDCFIMITFNPKMKITSSNDHFIICLFILIEFL